MGTGSAASAAETPGSEPTSNVSTESDVRLGRRLAVSLITAGCLIAAVLYAALPDSPFEFVPANVRQVAIGVVPEGWAFFTRSPRLPTPVAYEHQPNGGWRSLAAAPLARPSDGMGLNREGRARSTELAVLIDQMPRTAWHECKQDPLVCLSTTQLTATVVNAGNRTICGDIGIVVQDVLPWAFRNSSTIMPSKVTRIRVTC
jgi:antimicrobial peptide system SdpA family protein